MHRVIAEAESLPSARALLHAASLCLVDDEIGRGSPAAVAIAHGLRALDVPVADPGFEAATEQARHLDQVLERLPDTERDLAAVEHSAALVDRYATCASEDAREAILWWVLRGVPEDAGAVTDGRSTGPRPRRPRVRHRSEPGSRRRHGRVWRHASPR